MKTIRQIIKSTFIFSIFFVIEKVLLSFVVCNVLNSENYSFARIFLIAVSGNIKEIINDNWFLAFVFVVHEILELIAFSILTSYIFAFILNREPKIIFPDKLVIRHRTSDGSNGILTLGILIGNKSKFDIHNVNCTITCYYIKKLKPLLTNAEFCCDIT